MVDFFISRPVFSSAIALVITLAGAACMLGLPVAQYPEISPPQVRVSTWYTGASADDVSKAVTAPLEEVVNGVNGMIYLSSVSSNDGVSTITVTFEVGHDLDTSVVNVQSKTEIAKPRLPSTVVKNGIRVEKASSDLTLLVDLISRSGKYDQIFLSNYADIHLTDAISRIPGVSNVKIFGERKYAIRIWLHPDKLTGMGLTAMDIEAAVREQNVQVAAGRVGAPPVQANQAFQYHINTLGRLSQVEQFENIIVRTEPEGSIVRVRDVARVELGAENYDSSVTLDGKATAAMGIYQLPEANALDLTERVKKTMEEFKERFPGDPDDLDYVIAYDATTFVRASIAEVIRTLFVAIAIVFVVVFVFLQSWRSTVIPAIAIPVSLIGTFALMLLFGFSINTLTLLGLVLAIGLVVDDAIVVVENVQRQLEEGRHDPRQATKKAMAEVTNPIIATTLVLMAVLVPVAFLPGVTGRLYNQFALTIACAVGLSAINSLTLSPALCGILLRSPTAKRRYVFGRVNNLFKWSASVYRRGVPSFVRGWPLVAFVFGLFLAAAVYLIEIVPRSFLPEEDQGFFIVSIRLPDASALPRTEKITDKVDQTIRSIPGVRSTLSVQGFNMMEGVAQTNAATILVMLDRWRDRKEQTLHMRSIIRETYIGLAGITEAEVFVFNPPPIRGVSVAGGFEFVLQDRDAAGPKVLAEVADKMIEVGNQQPELARLFTSYSAKVPQLNLDIDRTKVKSLDISLDDVHGTLQICMGGLYVNDFNKFERVYPVYLQAEEDSRNEPSDISRLYVRNRQGEMIPLNALANVKRMAGPETLPHYNVYHSASIHGTAAPGYSSGQAIAAMERVAANVLPSGFAYEWTGTTYQEQKAGALAPIIFAMALAFIYLFLAAHFESWLMPLMVMLAVPLAVFGAMAAQWMCGLNNDVYCQIGMVMLIGLASKNAILIVEFAARRRREGLSIIDAATDAARLRLRPILITAFAFILGVLPLVFAEGPGAASRRSLGTTVFGGMLVSTMLSLIVVPVLYVLIQRMRECFQRMGRV